MLRYRQLRKATTNTGPAPQRRRKEYKMNYNYFPRKALYIDIDTGEILTYSEMIDRAEKEYGFDEFTPMCELWNCFEIYNG